MICDLFSWLVDCGHHASNAGRAVPEFDATALPLAIAFVVGVIAIFWAEEN